MSIHRYHHHHIVLVARISLTLSRHSSLSFIALGRSSGQHPVSSHSCWMYVRAGRPAFARPCVGIHKSTSLMSSSLLLQHNRLLEELQNKRLHTLTDTHIHTHAHAYTYMYIHIHAHTYTYTYLGAIMHSHVGKICPYKYVYISSSSSCRAGSTDIPDPLSPLLPIVHRPR